MSHLTLADVIAGLTEYQVDAPQPVTNVVIDSRQADKGSLFVALPGEHTDGHLFVTEAFHRGAMAAIIDRPVAGIPEDHIIDTGQPVSAVAAEQLPVCIRVNNSLAALQKLAAFWRGKFNPRVIGITGSVGKSTTKELLGAVLSTRYHTLISQGNLNNEIGLPLTLLNLSEAHERVVLEMGMYDLGEISLLCDIARPHVGVVTNVGEAHLERLGTIERIAQAKTELVQALPDEGLAILNYDDPRVLAMAKQTKAQVLTYGLSPAANLWASDVTSAGLEGMRFVLHYQDEMLHVRIPLLGRHSVHTALRATLAGLAEGLDWEEIIGGLQTLPHSAQLRLVAVTGPNESILLDDTYNANPTSTLAALNLLDDLSGARKIAVLGDMLELGSFEVEGHHKVGCRAADVVDLLVVIGERAKLIAAGAQSCGLAEAAVLEMENNEAAIVYLEKNLASGDIVLIKGSNAQRLDQIVSALGNRQTGGKK
jgi:UDP-N-acetylmuramoyl-tripeptide--D-alanyl-D-alanine ligase